MEKKHPLDLQKKKYLKVTQQEVRAPAVLFPSPYPKWLWVEILKSRHCQTQTRLLFRHTQVDDSDSVIIFQRV